MTARREMIFLFALNHQRTPQNLLGKGNQFFCQQRNPASNLSISSGKQTEPQENARVGGTAKPREAEFYRPLRVSLASPFASRATRAGLLMISHEGRAGLGLFAGFQHCKYVSLSCARFIFNY